MAETKWLALRAEVAPEIGKVTSDTRRAEQSRLKDAGKFTERAEVTLRAGAEGRWLCVAIAEAEIGIKPEHVDILFPSFLQIGTVLTGNHQDTGIDLVISRRLVTLPEAAIDAASKWGKGSAYTLPLR